MSVLEIPAADYHLDLVADQPTLSKSIIQILLTSSPAHAFAAHPKLNPDLVRKEEAKYDVGTAAHAVLLEGRENAVAVIDADSWRTNAAKEVRDHARAEGRVPLLAHDWADVQAMVAAVHTQLEALTAAPPLFTDGLPEQTLVWEEDGVVCKARLDWLRDDNSAIDDLKTTGASAAPETYSRTLLGIGGDLQAAFYLRGCRAVFGRAPAFRFAVVETSPPYGLTVFSIAPDALALADAKIDYALHVWRKCLETERWPAYPKRVCYVQSPGWAEQQWADREYRDAEVTSERDAA